MSETISINPARIPIAGRVAAVLLAVWSVMHVGAAVSTWMLADTVNDALAAARIRQNAWHLLAFAVFVGICVPGIWKARQNAAIGGAVAATVTDIGFIALLLIPDHVPIVPGIVGPLVWLLAMAALVVGWSKRS